MAVLSLLLVWYNFQGIQQLAANWRASARKGFYLAYWLFFVGFLGLFGYAFYVRFTTDHTTPFIQWVINAFLTLLVTQLCFALVLLAEDVVRLKIALFRWLRSPWQAPAERPESPMPGRRKFISQLALLVAALPFTSFVYGIVRGKYKYTLHRQVLYFNDLPPQFDGFTITQLSDIHSGSFTDPQAVQEGIQLAIEQQSDLFVFTGDLVNDQASEIEPYMKAFAQIKAPFGQYAILGNHDYGMYAEWNSREEEQANLEQLKQNIGRMGWGLLLDEHIALEKDGATIHLLGVENWGRGFIEKGDLDKALQGVASDSFKILLSHDPSHWTEVVRHHPAHIHLTLCGHTHGMQVGIETPLVKWSPVQYRYRYWAGLAQELGKMLYVNRGFGFIGFSGRVGIWPEISVLELRRRV
ncbi:phosphodiesterase YaeI [Cesiribacter andamanensis AMV16]|uniref:Phosphodiesterase YaeI n=2 Tax=Cesiribacter TaxID=1133570 RepID=M7NQ25_9BACT|nr:phosphodiesterase YaeI [Cesiribacter andamanensis AMV16]